MQRQFLTFIIRWVSNALVVLVLSSWAAAELYLAAGWSHLLLATLWLTLLNALLKPIIILLSLPFLYITWGFFSLVFNGLMLFLTTEFYDGFTIASWRGLLLAALGISLVNYLVTLAFKPAEFYQN